MTKWIGRPAAAGCAFSYGATSENGKVVKEEGETAALLLGLGANEP